MIGNTLGQLKELATLKASEHQPRTKREEAEKLRGKVMKIRRTDLDGPRYLEITRLERTLLTVRKKVVGSDPQHLR